ncbi:hypothetical protein [Aminipila terrae]|uniref:hypothetical protein n=1 Tax=Aminipila terrae TaxID=2697030 RepID=UPI001FAE35B4|nr:hypothetical protein [Aminipila terrae]
MIQRPHQILSEFANQGYRATLYNLNSQVQKVIEIKENFYSYNRIPPPFIKENKRVLWISYPPLYKQMTKFEKDLIIFDCIDYPEEQFKHWKRGIDQLRQDADFILLLHRSYMNLIGDIKIKPISARMELILIISHPQQIYFVINLMTSET